MLSPLVGSASIHDALGNLSEAIASYVLALFSSQQRIHGCDLSCTCFFARQVNHWLVLLAESEEDGTSDEES